jgi:hypothetical protein
MIPIKTTQLQISYYRLDGQCNNVENPLWGARLTPMIRIFDDGFIDGIENISPARTQESARFDSTIANDEKGRNSQRFPEINSDKSTAIGQLLTHEFMKTKKNQLHSDKRKGGFNCCAPKNEHPDSKLSKSIKSNINCDPISVKSKDSCYANFANCLNYIKSFRSYDNCQINASPNLVNFHNAPIDLELVYNELSLAHLSQNGGKFNVKDFVQMKKILVDYDERSMQLPGLLVVLHSYANFHNAIFDQLKRFKFSSDDATISFEARKITTGVFQHNTLEYFKSVLRLYLS